MLYMLIHVVQFSNRIDLVYCLLSDVTHAITIFYFSRLSLPVYSRKWKVANMNFALQQQWSQLEARGRGLQRVLSGGRLQYFHVDRFKHATLVELLQETVPWQQKFGPAIKV